MQIQIKLILFIIDEKSGKVYDTYLSKIYEHFADFREAW
jgi:hypothetical protein